MVLAGYNGPRPTRENYEDFLEKLVCGLNDAKIPGLSLMIYGSYVRKDYNPGRSDIDGMMVFPDDVVINKDNLFKASKVLDSALKDNPVPFQVNVLDLTTMRDGRFNSYDQTFKPYFAEEGKILVGPDYRNQFTYELPTFDEQIPVRFNLRKTRNGLLFAEYDKNSDYENFLRKFTKSLDAVSRASKQILTFSDGQVRKNRFSAIEELEREYPDISLEPLIRIKRLYAHLEELDLLMKNPEEVMNLWESSVTFMEKMLREYIKRNPRNK